MACEVRPVLPSNREQPARVLHATSNAAMPHWIALRSSFTGPGVSALAAPAAAATSPDSGATAARSA